MELADLSVPADLSQSPDFAATSDLSVASDLLEALDLSEDLHVAEELDMTVPPDLSGDLLRILFVDVQPASAVSALVQVTAPGATSVRIEFGANTSYGSITPSFALAGGHVEIPILGLDPQATTHLRVIAQFPDGASTSEDRVVTTPAPPFVLPVFTVSTTSAGLGGYFVLSTAKGTGYYAVSLLVDRTGRIMWYHDNSPWFTRGFDAQRLANGRLSSFISTGWHYDEVDLANRVTRSWVSAADLGADGHEMLLLPNDHALLFGTTQHQIDGGTVVLGATLEERHPDGGTVFSWNSEPEIAIDETTSDINTTNSPVDALHPNAIEVAPDGNLYASFRHLDSVMKIDRTNNHILWRLGGKKSDFTFLDDPENDFSHQHDIRSLGGGDIMLLDNGNLHGQPETRVVIYHLDENAKTARLTWSYRHTPAIFSFAAGSARRLANGNTVVTWAIQGKMTEIDASKNVLWEMSTSGWTIYRGLPVPTLYP